MTAYN